MATRGVIEAVIDTVVSEEELVRRTIRRSDYVSCDQAFIDSRTPGSEDKENYSIIGSGVSQSSTQVVSLEEPHGFNIGAAAMPHGVTNNLHLHFTAEVFLNFRGDWNIRWGVDGTDGEYVSHEGDVISVPTWVFRGFTNVGPDDGWLFTALGFDDTGGIVWAPSVLTEARRHGLALTEDSRLVELAPDEQPPPGTRLIEPMAEEQVARLRRWTETEMRGRVVQPSDLRWTVHPYLCSTVPGGGAERASVIGFGSSEDRADEPLIHNAHNFSLAWLKACTGEGVLRHRQEQTQALVVHEGRWLVTLNDGSDEISTEIGPFDTLSVPPGAWRSLRVVSGEGRLVVVDGGDDRVRLQWGDEVVAAAGETGVVLDAAGYRAPADVVRTSVADD